MSRIPGRNWSLNSAPTGEQGGTWDSGRTEGGTLALAHVSGRLSSVMTGSQAKDLAQFWAYFANEKKDLLDQIFPFLREF